MIQTVFFPWFSAPIFPSRFAQTVIAQLTSWGGSWRFPSAQQLSSRNRTNTSIIYVHIAPVMETSTKQANTWGGREGSIPGLPGESRESSQELQEVAAWCDQHSLCKHQRGPLTPRAATKGQCFRSWKETGMQSYFPCSKMWDFAAVTPLSRLPVDLIPPSAAVTSPKQAKGPRSPYKKAKCLWTAGLYHVLHVLVES